MTAGVPVLAVRHAQKRFGAVHALKDVDLEAYRGDREIDGLLSILYAR